jgi:hypothetical protein
MRPDYHRAIIDTVRYYGWKKIIYLYDSHDGKSSLPRGFLMHFSFYSGAAAGCSPAPSLSLPLSSRSVLAPPRRYFSFLLYPPSRLAPPWPTPISQTRDIEWILPTSVRNKDAGVSRADRERGERCSTERASAFRSTGTRQKRNPLSRDREENAFHAAIFSR